MPSTLLFFRTQVGKQVHLYHYLMSPATVAINHFGPFGKTIFFPLYHTSVYTIPVFIPYQCLYHTNVYQGLCEY